MNLNTPRLRLNRATVREHSPSPESGAIIILVEFLAVILLLVAGLAIDGAMIATTKTQHKHIADYVALEALHSYINAPGSADAKMQKAKERAQDIAGVNFFISKPFLVNPNLDQEIGAKSNSSSVAGPNGLITPGIWHFAAPADCTAQPSPCPCEDGSWAGPCFQEIDISQPSFPEIRAFKVDLKLRDTSPIRTLFARVRGAGSGGTNTTVTLSSQAMSAIVPRHAVFLVDLSRSSQIQTHYAWETLTNGNPRPLSKITEAAYKLTNACANGDPAMCPAGLPAACNVTGGEFTPLNQLLWANMSGARGMNPTVKDKHYRDDYRCYSFRYNDDAWGPSPLNNYIVDTFRNSVAGYQGMEPLMTMLDGVHYALFLLRQRTVPGDLAGAIGFDLSAGVAERTFAMSAPNGNACDACAGEPFCELNCISDVYGQTLASIDKRYGEHFFFPRLNANANFPEALHKAFLMLRNAPESQIAENSVVLISDGLTNCTIDRNCSSDEAGYAASVAQATQILTNDYVPNNIRFHLVMVGQASLPHTVLAPSYTHPTMCMREEEARSHNPPLMFVDARAGGRTFGEAVSLLSDAYYYQANGLYRDVQRTGGVWAPIRPPCNNRNITTDLDDVCNGRTPEVVSGLPEQPVAVPDVFVEGTRITDASGRVLCDPLGRPERDQIREAMTDIFRRSPYLLVQ